jgi:hypothetical protein
LIILHVADVSAIDVQDHVTAVDEAAVTGYNSVGCLNKCQPEFVALSCRSRSLGSAKQGIADQRILMARYLSLALVIDVID